MEQVNSLYLQGRAFEKNKSIDDRKAKGVFYTPLEVVDYMVRNTIASLDIINNPYAKIVDISCGAGYFLIRYFEAMRSFFQQNYNEIITLNPQLKNKLSYEDIGRFIIEHNIWGADIDSEAVTLVKESLDKAAGCSCKSNIICTDSLLGGLENTEHKEFWAQQYDCVIGNPPYIGHKGVPSEYKSILYKHYKDVYKDKADISYCFFKRGMELLKPRGVLCFITSRYFMEGPSADKLRSFIAAYDVEELVDFGDCKVFADAGVSVAIISIRKQSRLEEVRVKKLKICYGNSEVINIDETEAFYINKSFLKKEGWVLLEPKALEIYTKLEGSSTHQLGDIFDSYQGIITGCDKAFVLNEVQAKELGIEKELLKPWIKNSHVDKFEIKNTDKLIIYSDLITEPASFPQAIAFAEAYKNKLMQRRECKRGVRHWYQLQWGRDIKNFEHEKIVYPYKAAKNRFAVDRKGLYCSADVYSLIIKEEFKGIYSLDYITALLNSKTMEFYFKCIAKKISPTLYDYYPNKVLKIGLQLNEFNEIIGNLAKTISTANKSIERKCILQAIDREIYKMYNFNESQIEIIENSAGE
ncbi:MAG: adenine-specific methylase [Clostridia bacterium]|nr:adenine-specific methylase [Clostridia bacterium]